MFLVDYRIPFIPCNSLKNVYMYNVNTFYCICNIALCHYSCNNKIICVNDNDDEDETARLCITAMFYFFTSI